MAQQNENLDFSGLFKLDVLIQLNIKSYCFYEVGLKKFLSFSSNEELVFVYINHLLERSEKKYDWDFLDNPVFCMCFEPSGTWVTIISEDKVLLVPFLPLFIPQNVFDCKWSLSRVTVLPLGELQKPTSVVWWLTKESENILIIGTKTGTIAFYSLEAQVIIGEAKIANEIVDLQICFDDSLDLLTLLVTSNKNQYWKLVLEHRSYDYNWLHQMRLQSDRDKKDFMSYIKQLSKDKITFFSQGGSRDDKQTVEYVLKPTEYLPIFRKSCNTWALTAQYVNGRHFLAAFELTEGTLILESPEESMPSRVLRPQINQDGVYVQGLWSPRLIYLLKNNRLEVHSTNFSVIQGEAPNAAKKEYSILWSAELLGVVRRAHLMTAKEPQPSSSGWKEPTFLCDLQLPRFSLEQCLIVTSSGAFIFNMVCEPCEWLVGAITRGGAGAEQAAAALGAPVPTLLKASADLLLARGKMAPAQYLYFLSQSQPDGWLARLGVFGKLTELSTFKQAGNNMTVVGNVAVTIKLLATLLKVATDNEVFDTDAKLTSLGTAELTELCTIAASIGLWSLVPTFSIHRGQPSLLLNALKSRTDICRGALRCMLGQSSLVPLLLEENGQWLFNFISERCHKFDTTLLKCLFLWLNPLQDQLRPIMRDLKQGIPSIYTTRLQHLISTFIDVACAIEAREPCPEIHLETKPESETWKTQFVSRRSLSCGLNHFAIVDDGNAKIVMANTPINTEMIGRVLDVACGRHHTLVLTENGLYASGDNSYGQLGAGARWRGGVGEGAAAGGALLPVRGGWRAPLLAVAAGHYHSAAVDAGGRLYTWGWGVHGQLCLGSIDDKHTPQLVTKLQGRKVIQVGLGSCHSVLLTRSGEVFAAGAGVFQQLGSSRREKSSVPVLVNIEPVASIAVGYFHTLALTKKGVLYSWGGSPQQVRAAHARRAAAPAPAPAPTDEAMVPHAVQLKNVKGHIVQMSAGWHHSCIVDNFGNVYSWGLNFDGQLGSGDRKQIQIPTQVRIRSEVQPDNTTTNKQPMDVDENFNSKALIGCGGDFTIFIDDDGKIYSTGNMHLQPNTALEKVNNKVIMMKTTKRVIKIPTSRSNKKFLFQPIDNINIMFPFDIEDLQRQPINPHTNTMRTMKSFNDKSWADNVIIALKPWIKEENLSSNLNMAAKYAFHNKMYAKCLKQLLENLNIAPPSNSLYLTHTEMVDCEDITEQIVTPKKKNENLNFVITNVVSKRIKDISLSILNEQPYPVIDAATYKAIPCCCDELKYLNKNPQTVIDISEKDLSLNAANIIDKCMGIFPVDTQLWEACFRFSKDFFLKHNLSVPELEKVLRKYMESNSTTMAGAIMYSNDCTQYNEMLTPKFYLNMCSEVLDTWG